MSVQSQIDRINQNIKNTYNILQVLGVDMPNEQTSGNLAETAGSAKVVLHSEQNLTDDQKAQARKNIGAVSKDDITARANVKDFGAVGDGVTDDTKAFRDALANNRIVTVPGGTYLLSDALVIRENCCLELSQDTVLQFTNTSGNCIDMRASATLRGNHAIISVPYAFTGNVVAIDTNLETGDLIIPPYKKIGSHMFKRQRFVYDVNIIKPDGSGFCRSDDGSCNGTAVYMRADSTVRHMWMWALTLSGIRIAGGFSYGIRAINIDSPIDSSGHYEDDAWNHDMRIEAVIEACEVGVALENCNGAHLAVTIQPCKGKNNGAKYAKHGVYLNDSKYVEMIGSRVWDWNDTNTLWTPGGQYQHLALIGNCRGLILDDFLVYESSMPIRDLIYTDTPGNFDKMTILQEPGGSKSFKAIDGEPYFNDGNSDIRLASKSDIDEYFVTERIKGYTDALSAAIDTDGSIYNGIGYNKYGGALNSAGAIIPDTNSWYGHTGFIACKPGDVIYIKGIKLTEADGYTKAFTYDADFNLLGQNNTNAIIAGTAIGEFTGTATEDDITLTVVRKNTAYMRIGFKSVLLSDDPVIAVNEEIKYTQAGFLAGGIKVKGENVIGGTGGGSSAPSDWNAAEGEPGHVLNRTHWRDVTETVLFEKTVTITQYQFMDTSGASIPLNVGDTYTVVWDGVSYEAVAKVMDYNGFDAIAVGNAGVLPTTGEENTGEPFLIAIIEGMGWGVISLADGEHTFAISGNEYTYHTIPPEYLAGSKPFFVEVDIWANPPTTTVTQKEIKDALLAGYQLVAGKREGNFLNFDYYMMDTHKNNGTLTFHQINGDELSGGKYTARFTIIKLTPNASGGYDVTVKRDYLPSSDSIPYYLPNPKALTINGTVYDGSEAVELTLGSTSGFPELNSVKDFGAVGDGVTDDTVAIQAALDAGGLVYFPAGRYKVTAQLNATKPCTISMFRQYPSNAYDDYPKSSDDNYMGARIETYSPTNGIVIGDSVNLDGFYIRAMAGFGSGATAGTYGGKGIILQYDGSLGYRSYPSAIRLRHIRVDIAYGTSAEIYAVIPECLFHFAPKASYHYIIEDVQLGQHNGMKYCDYAFRADLAKNASWSHNVFVRNMNIEAHCDYGVHITGNSGSGGNACGWMFDGLVIQAYGYIQNDASNVQNRPGHRALLKMSGVDDIAFYSCYLWDTGGTATYPAYYSDGGEIVVNGSAKADTIKDSTTVISCVGCSSHFNVCETYIHKKLNSPENLNIKDLTMSVTADEATGGNRLTLDDGTYRQSAVIPSAVISEEQITSSVNQYLDDATTPKKNIGRNKFDASRNGDKTLTAYDDFNLEGDVYGAAGGGAFYDKASTNMWSTHFIPAEYGDVIRMSKNGVLVQAYRFCCFNANMEWLGTYHVWSGSSGAPETIDYRKPHIAIKGTAFIRICFDRTTMISYPTDSEFPNLCITVNDTDISYEPYEEKYETKMGGLLPIVTEADNGKVLKVVNGVWVAVAE